MLSFNRRIWYAVIMLAGILIGGGTALGASGPRLVRDINPGSADSTPQYFASVGKTLFFRATDPRHGAELWASNGTAAGTRLVKDINPGPASSDPYGLNNAGGRVFFRATDPTHGTELWVSNGTARGTRMVRDINPGSAGSDPDHSRPGHPSSMIRDLGGTPYFVAYDPAHGYELWTSDGTAAGTHLVKDVYPGATSSRPTDPTLVGRTVFFGATDPSHGAQLWATNGTAAGTRRVTNLHPAFGGLYPTELTDMGGRLYFIGASATARGSQLWRSDGTAAGTGRVDPAGRESGASDLTDVGRRLFFAASDARGRELWRSDGSAAGTGIVKNINPSTDPSSNGSYPNQLTDVGGTLFFVARDATHGDELWRSDGTAAGTRMVRDLRPGPAGSRLSSLTAVDGNVFFIAFNFARGYGSGDLWRSNGTAAGTSLVKTWPLQGHGTLRNVLGTLFFTAYEKTHGYELWSYVP